jgi:hypothetical protein
MAYKPRIEAAAFFDLIEEKLRAGFSINDTARRLKISCHCINKCIQERPHLAEIAKANGKKNQGVRPWER